MESFRMFGNISHRNLEQKQKAWDLKKDEVDLITDGLGMPIDEGIKETVVALQILGINTISSHEGKMNRYPVPFVDITSTQIEDGFDLIQKREKQLLPESLNTLYDKKDKLLKRYQDIISSGGEEHNKETLDYIDHEIEILDNEIEKEYDNTIRNDIENDAEYKKLVEQHQKNLQEKVDEIQILLDEFYKNRNLNEEAKLILEIKPTRIRIHSTAHEKQLQEITDENISEIKKRLESFQKEMEDFTFFMKQKYFNS